MPLLFFGQCGSRSWSRATGWLDRNWRLFGIKICHRPYFWHRAFARMLQFTATDQILNVGVKSHSWLQICLLLSLGLNDRHRVLLLHKLNIGRVWSGAKIHRIFDQLICNKNKDERKEMFRLTRDWRIGLLQWNFSHLCLGYSVPVILCRAELKGQVVAGGASC